MTNVPKARVLSKKRAFQGYHALDVFDLEHDSLQPGAPPVKLQREVLNGAMVACILPYIPETDELLLNQQFRVGAFLMEEPNPFLYECAAGAVDDGETPEQAARRECLEETGCTVVDIEFIGICYPSPGSMDAKFYLYLGRVEKATPGYFGFVDEGEEIKTHLLPAAAVIDMLDRNEINNAATMISVHWFSRHHQRLRQKWLKK